MNNKIVIVLVFFHFLAIGQHTYIALDTVSSKEFERKLINEFIEKNEFFNKNLDLLKSNQKKIIKEIYSENQKDFLETIKNNNFICDKKTNIYLKDLLSDILNKNNIISNNYKILLSKDSEINAYAIGDGTLVLNYGLFLAVENEDELVFVICHEIAHQNLNHVKSEIENYAIQSTSEDIIKKTNEIRKLKYNKATLANNLLKTIKYKNYNQRRTKEVEADSLGLIFYKKTLRNPKYAITLLSKLDKANKENDSISIEDYKLCFEKNDFKINTKYFETEESLFRKYDYKNNFAIDSLKTHPDCNTRINLIKNKIEKEENNFSKSLDFSAIKENSINQNLLNLYARKDYAICLYETLKLFKKDLNNDFFKNIIFLSLNKIYKSKSNYTISRYLPIFDSKNNTKSLNTFISFVNNIKMNDLEIIINQYKP